MGALGTAGASGSEPLSVVATGRRSRLSAEHPIVPADPDGRPDTGLKGEADMPTRVEVVDYDHDWPQVFLDVSKHLSGLLGSTVIAIDHVGSTAVPGLAAKPIIDVDVTMDRAEAIAAGSAALVADGFVARGNRYDDGVWAFAKHGSPGQRVYLCPRFSDTHCRRLIFRDELRRSPEMAEAYAALKRGLAIDFAYDGDGYTVAKRRFIDEVVERFERIV